MRVYSPGDYLSGFECPMCGGVDKLFYNDCPCCEEDFVECAGCGKKWAKEECKATYEGD